MVRTDLCFLLISCLVFLPQNQGQETQTELPSARISCPEGANAHGAYCYYFNTERLTWVEADLFCQNMHSGHLVSVLNQAEGAFVASLIKESSTQDYNVWVGLYDPKKNRRWHWISGSLFSYKAWTTGAPSSTKPGYCVSLVSNTGFLKWKDVSCESTFSFVCKFKY